MTKKIEIKGCPNTEECDVGPDVCYFNHAGRCWAKTTRAGKICPPIKRTTEWENPTFHPRLPIDGSKAKLMIYDDLEADITSEQRDSFHKYLGELPKLDIRIKAEDVEPLNPSISDYPAMQLAVSLFLIAAAAAVLAIGYFVIRPLTGG